MADPCPRCSLPPFTPTIVSSSILETNDPPFESQIPGLRDFISRARVRLGAIDAKIAMLQSAMDELREESDAIAIEIRKHEGGLSPLRRLPTEILSLIFTFTLPPYAYVPYTEPAPWTVSAVCARWRTTVISQPLFWTSIDYTYVPRSLSRVRLEAQLRRSGRMPLSIEFHTEDTSTMASEDLHMLQMLCQHAGRWEKFTIWAPGVVYSHLAGFIQDQLTLLRKLEVEMEYDEEDSMPPMDIFNDAPLLQEVLANKQSLFTYPLPLVLPWSQLLRYGGSNTWDGHLHALRTAYILIDCCLEIQETPNLPPTPPILLPCLLRLSLSNPGFLDCLETPALLELYCGYSLPVLPFVRRRSCQLQKLVVWEYSEAPADATDLVYIVEALPTVTHLAALFFLPVEFARDFCSRPNNVSALTHLSCALPSAEDMNTWWSTDPYLPTEAGDIVDTQNYFIQAVESRWHGSRLKSVKVKCSAFAPGILERMELLQSQGMEFEVLPHHYSLVRDAVPPEMSIEGDP